MDTARKTLLPGGQYLVFLVQQLWHWQKVKLGKESNFIRSLCGNVFQVINIHFILSTHGFWTWWCFWRFLKRKMHRITIRTSLVPAKETILCKALAAWRKCVQKWPNYPKCSPDILTPPHPHPHSTPELGIFGFLIQKCRTWWVETE